MDIQLRISDYSSHKDLISVLSPLFEVGNDESIRFVLDMPSADETICIYPDYFLLVVSVLKFLNRSGKAIAIGILNDTDNTNIQYENDDSCISYFNGEIRSKASTKKVIEISEFDGSTIGDIYNSIMQTLNSISSIDLTVLQALGYCFYELLDNVLNHSEIDKGLVVVHYDEDESIIRIMICDTGIGIYKSLTTAPKNACYGSYTEEDALLKCIEDKVTNGKGMGFGLFSTSGRF